MSQIRLAYQELFEGKPIERSSYADFMHIFDENDDDTLAPANQKRTFVGRQKCVFCCDKRVKRCLNKGKNEQKVSDSTYIKGNRDSFAYNVICF